MGDRVALTYQVQDAFDSKKRALKSKHAIIIMFNGMTSTFVILRAIIHELSRTLVWILIPKRSMDTSSSSAWNTLSRMPDGRPVHKRASSAPTPSLRASEISTIFNRNTSAVPHYGHESYQEYDGHTRNVHGTEIPIKVKKITCLGSGFVGGTMTLALALDYR